jgi:hypothetical protein
MLRLSLEGRPPPNPLLTPALFFFFQVRSADQIVVVAGKGIVAQGSHDELLSSSPAYAELVKRQLQGGASCDTSKEGGGDHDEEEGGGRAVGAGAPGAASLGNRRGGGGGGSGDDDDDDDGDWAAKGFAGEAPGTAPSAGKAPSAGAVLQATM